VTLPETKAPYQDFNTVRKDADATVPALLAANAEYANPPWSFAEILQPSFPSSRFV
jgi:hypothetical protein